MRNSHRAGWFSVASAGTMSLVTTAPLSSTVAPENATKSIFRKPMYATNTPMPPPIAFCRLFGIALMMYLRIFVTVITMLNRPQMNTIDSACCQVKPRPKQTV